MSGAEMYSAETAAPKRTRPHYQRGVEYRSIDTEQHNVDTGIEGFNSCVCYPRWKWVPVHYGKGC